MHMLTHWAAMRIGEVAALRVEDILGKDGTVKSEIRRKRRGGDGAELI